MARTTNKEMMELLMTIQKGMEEMNKEIKSLRTDVDALKKPAIGSKASKGSKKQSAKAEAEKKPQTRKEGIDAWCQKKGYSEADRKAYGAAKKAERELQKQAYELTNSQFSEKVEYKVWRKQYEANLVKLQAQAK